MKPAAVISLLIVLLVGSGAYYYFFIWEPQNFVSAALELKQRIDLDGQVLTQSDIKGQYDYKGALDTLAVRRHYLEASRDNILKLKTPSFNQEIQDFHKSWLAAVEGHLMANADAEERVKLLAGFSEIGFLLEKDPKPPLDEKTARVRDMQEFLEKIFGGLKQAMHEAIQVKEPRINGENEFSELKPLWVKTEPALDIMLSFIRAQDSDAKLAGYSPKGSTRQPQEASENITKFGDALKKLLEQNTAYDILAYRYFDGFDQKVIKPNQGVDSALEKLKEKHL